MSPEISLPVIGKSADDLSRQMGRELEEKDVLMDNRYPNSPEYWEVVDPKVGGRTLLRIGPVKLDLRPSVKVRQLTSYGPSETTKLFTRGDKRWSDVVLHENRSTNHYS